jgi:hypothetical protein
MNDRDVLISRIVDREDGPADWTSFDELARMDARVTVGLVAAMRDDATLRAAMDGAVAVADRVGLRSPPLVRMRSLVHWGGWMAAAVLALVWMATNPRLKRAPESAPPEPMVRSDASDTPHPARSASEVVQELPNVMMESRPIPGSDEIEIVYLRRAIERAIVSDAYTVGRDETGHPFRVRADLTQFVPKRSY